MRVLVAIANHGHGNRRYLDAVLHGYRAASRHEVSIVVLSNVPKDLGPDVEVRVGVPSSNPWSLPFAHRAPFAERADDFDLFVYGEDDTLVGQRAIDAFAEAAGLLADDEIAGFVRSEQDAEGRLYCPSIHSHHHWDPGSVRLRGSATFARLTNDHAACCMLTRDQLRRAIASGGFLVGPHEGRYGMLESAATDVYTQCGFTRLIWLSRIDDFILPHLPNKYVGKMGVPRAELLRQVNALIEIGRGDRTRGRRLYEPVAFRSDGLVERHYYEHRRDDVLALVPPGAMSVLSVGAGWGETEAALSARGAAVTVIPLDSVVAESSRARGLRVLEPDLAEALGELADASFDCLLFCDVLQHFGEPAEVLRRCARALRPGGHVVVSEPNAECIQLRRVGVRPNGNGTRNGNGNGDGEVDGDGNVAGVRPPRRADVRRWLARAGLRTQRIVPPPATAHSALGRQAQRWLGRWFAWRFLVLAVK